MRRTLQLSAPRKPLGPCRLASVASVRPPVRRAAADHRSSSVSLRKLAGAPTRKVQGKFKAEEEAEDEAALMTEGVVVRPLVTAGRVASAADETMASNALVQLSKVKVEPEEEFILPAKIKDEESVIDRILVLCQTEPG